MTELRYVHLSPELADQCAELELRSFPTADPEELLSADDIAAYAETFPEGFFVCLDGDRVVGQGAGIFLDFDFDDYSHSIVEITSPASTCAAIMIPTPTGTTAPISRLIPTTGARASARPSTTSASSS